MSIKKLQAVALVGGMLLLSGCRSASYRGSAYGPPPADYGVAMDESFSRVPAVPTAEKGFVDRHPLLAAPRNYYRDSSGNLFAKVFYGTVVGIPVGIARETQQMLYGQ